MVTRRTVVLGVAALAGCARRPGSGTPDGTRTTAGGRPTRTTARAGTATSGTGSLDLREANVTDVAWAGDPGGDVRFDVTLYHDDDGEDGYANWWQVETLGGERLGRRNLLHAHGTRAFTRSATVAVPAGVGCVAIRGHDETHGYGGQAALVGFEAGTFRLVRQGADPSSFSAADCP
ncbi:MAG: hypothetical protein ABEI11_03995 [Haloarculaceae archaeon]